MRMSAVHGHMQTHQNKTPHKVPSSEHQGRTYSLEKPLNESAAAKKAHAKMLRKLFSGQK